jgi:hypothetical protein
MAEKSDGHKRTQVLIWVLVVIVVVLGAALVLTRASNKKSASSSPTPTASAQISPTPSTSQQTTAVGECKTSQLSASLLPASSAAGTSYQTIVLTNVSSSNCTVEGYPGVSLADANGSILGASASRDTVTTPSQLTLAPNKSAYANVGFPDPGNFSPGQCSTPAAIIKIFPPDQTTALKVANTMQYCPGFSVTALSAQLQ